jgi:hypothetical protein
MKLSGKITKKNDKNAKVEKKIQTRKTKKEERS